MITIDTIVESRKKWVIDHIMPSDLDIDIKEGLKKKEELIKKINGDYIRKLYSNIDEIIDNLNKYNVNADDYQRFIDGQISIEDIRFNDLAKIHTFYSKNGSEYIEVDSNTQITVKDNDKIILRHELEGNHLDSYSISKVQWNTFPTDQSLDTVPVVDYVSDYQGNFQSKEFNWKCYGEVIEGNTYINDSIRGLLSPVDAGNYYFQIYSDSGWKNVSETTKSLPDIASGNMILKQFGKKVQFSFDGGETYNYVPEWDFEFQDNESLEKCDFRLVKVTSSLSEFSDYDETKSTRTLNTPLLAGNYILQVETSKGWITAGSIPKVLTDLVSAGEIVAKQTINTLPVFKQLEFSFDGGTNFSFVPEWFYTYEEGSTDGLENGNIRFVEAEFITGTYYKDTGKIRIFNNAIPQVAPYYLQMKIDNEWKRIGTGYRMLRGIEANKFIVKEINGNLKFSINGGESYITIDQWDYEFEEGQNLYTNNVRLQVAGLIDGKYTLYTVFQSTNTLIEGLSDSVLVNFKLENSYTDLMSDNNFVAPSADQTTIQTSDESKKSLDDWKEQYRGLDKQEILDKLSQQTDELQDEITEYRKEQEGLDPESEEYKALDAKIGGCCSMMDRQCSLYNHCDEDKDIDDFELDDESDENACGTDFCFNNLPSLDPQMLILMFEVFLKRLLYPILKLLNYILGILRIDFNVSFPEIPLEFRGLQQVTKIIDQLGEALANAIDAATELVNKINLNALENLMDRLIALICKEKAKLLGIAEESQARINHANIEYQQNISKTKDEFKKALVRAENFIDTFASLGSPTVMMETLEKSMGSMKNSIESTYDDCSKYAKEYSSKLKDEVKRIKDDCYTQMANVINSGDDSGSMSASLPLKGNSGGVDTEIEAAACSADPALIININLDLDSMFKQVVEAIDDALNQIADALTNAFDNVFDALSGLLDALANLFTPGSYDLGEGLRIKLPIIPDLGKLILDTLMKLVITIINIMCRAIQKVTDSLKNHLNELIDDMNNKLDKLKNDLNHEIEELNKIFPERKDMPEDCKSLLDQVKFTFDTTVTDCASVIGEKTESIYEKFSEDSKAVLTKFCTLKPDSFMPNLDFLDKLADLGKSIITGHGEEAADQLDGMCNDLNEFLEDSINPLTDKVNEYRKKFRENTPEEDAAEAAEKEARAERQSEREAKREELAKRAEERAKEAAAKETTVV